MSLPKVDDVTSWYLCDRCSVQHYGMGSMLFGCERMTMVVKPIASEHIDPHKLCGHFEPKVVTE